MPCNYFYICTENILLNEVKAQWLKYLCLPHEELRQVAWKLINSDTVIGICNPSNWNLVTAHSHEAAG